MSRRAMHNAGGEYDLLEREEDAERYLLLAPEIGSIAEHIKQVFSRFLVKFLSAWQLLENNEKAGLLAGFMKCFGKTFSERIVVLGALFGQMKGFSNDAQHLLARERLRAMRIQKMLAKTNCLVLQFGHPKRPD